MQHVDMLSRIPESQPEANSISECAVGTAGTESAGHTAAGGRAPVAGRSVGDAEAAISECAVGAVGTESAGQTAAGGRAPVAGCSAGDAEAAGGRVNFVDGADRSSLSADRDSIIWYQKHDKDCRALVHHLKFKKWPKFCSPALKKEDINNFALRDGILCVQGQTGAEQRIVWPRAKRFEMLYQHHDISHHGHCGHEKLYEKLSRHIWYVGLKRDCKNRAPSKLYGNMGWARP